MPIATARCTARGEIPTRSAASCAQDVDAVTRSGLSPVELALRAVSAAAGCPVEPGVYRLAPGEEAGAVERGEVLADQVLVDLDEADFFWRAVDDEGFDARPTEIADRLKAVGAGDQEEQAGVVRVLLQDDRVLQAEPGDGVGEGGYGFGVDRAEAWRNFDRGEVYGEDPARAGPGF